MDSKNLLSKRSRKIELIFMIYMIPTFEIHRQVLSHPYPFAPHSSP